MHYSVTVISLYHALYPPLLVEQRTMVGVPREREGIHDWRYGASIGIRRRIEAPTWSNINKQTVRSPSSDTMALPSGIYTVKNVKYGNWAMLLNANEGEVVAGSSASTNVGEKVSLLQI